LRGSAGGSSLFQNVRMLRIVRNLVLILFVAWLSFTAVMAYEMYRPPAQFTAFMAHLPMISMEVAPFETIWMRARAGTLHPGDMAPDFHLKTRDGKSEVSLSSFRGTRPVVLIFGSYT
jgi:hypothetical protein